ncbi:hypothetical protein [Pseudoalteromonas phage PH357]|nr:hypothetical protein [Pseudoalteromonas phage PH357]
MRNNEEQDYKLFSDDSNLRDCKRKIKDLLREYDCELFVSRGILIRDKVSGEMYILDDNQ